MGNALETFGVGVGYVGRLNDHEVARFLAEQAATSVGLMRGQTVCLDGSRTGP